MQSLALATNVHSRFTRPSPSATLAVDADVFGLVMGSEERDKAVRESEALAQTLPKVDADAFGETAHSTEDTSGVAVNPSVPTVGLLIP